MGKANGDHSRCHRGYQQGGRCTGPYIVSRMRAEPGSKIRVDDPTLAIAVGYGNFGWLI
jgi:hypothetical protein